MHLFQNESEKLGFSYVTAANSKAELHPLDVSCIGKLQGYLKQLFPV